MARRYNENKNTEKVASERIFWPNIMESVKVLVVEGIKSTLYDLMDILRTNVERIQQRMMQLYAYYFLMGLSIIFLAIAVINLMKEYLFLSSGWSYLLTGAAVMVAAFAVKSKNKEKKKKEVD